MWVKDKKGQWVYVSYVPDCEPNEGGIYCETYVNELMDKKIDDFCIHRDDCDCSSVCAVEQHIADYYKDIELDLNYNF